MGNEADTKSVFEDAEAIGTVRDAMDGYFEVDFAHCDRHVYNEGFTYEQAYDVVRMGAIIETYTTRDRWLFAATVLGLGLDIRFRGRSLHVCVEWREGTDVFVVTMYRPRIQEWRSETKRV